MPWTCLHRDWLEDYDFTNLSLTNRGVLFCLHMLAARFDNRIPLDHRWIGHKIAAPPHVVGKAIATLTRVGLVAEFAEDTQTSRNKDLVQILGAKSTPAEGETETDLKIEGPLTPRDAKVRYAGTENSAPARNGAQPPFKLMTQACMNAGVRGSDHHAIAAIIKGIFDFEPSNDQLAVLERQIIDRRKE